MVSELDSFYHKRSVLILGGLGFIGSTLAHLLVKYGAKVTLIDNYLPDHGANSFNLEGIRDQVRVHISDLRNREALSVLVKDQDMVFNLAAQTSHLDSMTEPFLDLDINCRGNLTFLEVCREQRPDLRVVYVGTRAFYGAPKQTPVSEEAPLKPLDIYSVNRLAAEQYHFVYHQHYGLPVTSLRLGNLYGPRGQMQHPRYNVLNYFVRMALEKRIIQIYGDGLQQRDYVYIEDACNALLLAGASEQAIGKIYNVGSGGSRSFLDLVQEIIRLSNQGDYQHRDWPKGSKAFDVGDFITDITAIKKDLNWRPQTSISEGLGATIDFYRKHANHYWTQELII